MYTQALTDYVIRGPAMVWASETGLVCDKEQETGEDGMLSYFHNAHSIFVEHIMKLRDTSRPLSSDDEKELRFMFDALLSAKELLQDKENEK